MVKSLCHLLIQVSQIFNVANMSFNAIRENKNLAKISEFTVRLKIKIIIMTPLMCNI